GGVSPRRPDRRAGFVDAAAGSVEDHDGGMRAGAGRMKYRADQPLLADFLAADAVRRQPLDEGFFEDSAVGPPYGHRGFERPRDRVGKEVARTGFFRRLRPDEAHGVRAAVAAADGCLPG